MSTHEFSTVCPTVSATDNAAGDDADAPEAEFEEDDAKMCTESMKRRTRRKRDVALKVVESLDHEPMTEETPSIDQKPKSARLADSLSDGRGINEHNANSDNKKSRRRRGALMRSAIKNAGTRKKHS